jgi:hypothetical protein
VLVGGGKETDRIANWARIQKKPLLPVVRFGGAASQIYTEERDAFEKKYAGAISKEQFEDLAEATSPSADFCNTLVSVAERISRLAFAIMSFDPRHEATYETIRTACREAGYECRKISEDHDVQRISPAIRDRIGACAFAVVDISARSPNVYYELGFAEGVKQKFIVTAREGTKLPFDISDLQVLFWKDPSDLADKLPSRIEELYPVTPTRL